MILAMNISALVLAASSATTAPPRPARPTPQGFAMVSVMMYQPDAVLQRRLGGQSDALAGYIKKIVELSSASLAKTVQPAPLDIVVAVKPGKRARVWFVTRPADPNGAALASLRTSLEALVPPDVKEGPVAFAIVGGIGGATRPEANRDDASLIPMPDEWRKVTKGKKDVVVPDGVLAVVWVD
jgi:hypothetical protein